MRELMSYLPENYPVSRETVAFQNAIQPEVGVLWDARDDLLVQLDPYTATWGLDYWEASLGLSNGQGLDLDTRRRTVVAKLQGRATTTPEVVETVAETLLGVPITVVELFGEYMVLLVTPAGYLPRPRAIRLREQMRDIMPAHLDLQIVIPTVTPLSLTGRLGPRSSQTALPPFQGTIPDQPSYMTPCRGWVLSTLTLPQRAADQGG